MHYMRIPPISVFLLLFIGACAPRGALSPEEAFASLQKAYHRSDAREAVALLSQNSMKKISEITSAISGMEDEQINALSSRLNIPVKKLRTLSPED